MFTVMQREGRPGEIHADREEALRYLGYGGQQPEDAIVRLIESCEQELLGSIQARACWMKVPVSFPALYTVDFGFGAMESVSLCKHLTGCHSAYLFAATLGIGVDRLMARFQRTSPSRAAVIDALASSAIEVWGDCVEQELVQDEEKHCQRFSPGYGDFSLDHQKDFERVLQLPRQIGVALTESLLMVPSKSITAVIGLGASSRTCGTKCMLCTKTNCIYREVLL